jgi:hypothetical protein
LLFYMYTMWTVEDPGVKTKGPLGADDLAALLNGFGNITDLYGPASLHRVSWVSD